MIVESILAGTVMCSSLLPINPGAVESKHLLGKSITSLSDGVVYRKWDLNLDGRADIMTTHLIDPTQLERYRQLNAEGTEYDVHFSQRPTLYWVDLTGKDSWDRIYIDRQDNGRCTVYANKDKTA